MNYGTDSHRVQEAQRLDAADFIAKDFHERIQAKTVADAKNKADAEAAASQKAAVAHHAQVMVNKRIARGVARKAFPKKRKSLADFARGIFRKDAAAYLEEHYGAKRQEWPDGEVLSVKAAMAETSGAIGGYTVPTPMARTILGPYLQRSVFRANGALQLPTRSRSVYVPTPDVTTAPAAGVPPWGAGLNFAWTTEARTRAESEPKFKQVELVKNELSGSIVLSNALFQDGSSVALQEVLASLIGQAVQWLEDYAFFQGTGIGQPQGVFGANATIQLTRQTGGSIVYADVAAALAKLPPGSLDYAVWAFNPTALPRLLQLSDGTTRSVFFSTGDSKPGSRPQWSLAGLPAVPTDTLPALGSKGDLVLLDPRFYAVHDHGDAPGGTVEIVASPHVNFLTNQIVLRVVRRTDGQVLIEKPITLGDGATQVSPFIVLN